MTKSQIVRVLGREMVRLFPDKSGFTLGERWLGRKVRKFVKYVVADLSAYYMLVPQKDDWERAPYSFNTTLHFKQNVGQHGKIQAYTNYDRSSMVVNQPFPGDIYQQTQSVTGWLAAPQPIHTDQGRCPRSTRSTIRGYDESNKQRVHTTGRRNRILQPSWRALKKLVRFSAWKQGSSWTR